MKRASFCTLLAVAVSCTAVLATSPAYTVTDLGTLGHDYSLAYGINNSGVVVGFSYDQHTPSLPFRWDPSTGMVALPLLSGFYDRVATGINDDGTIVGKLPSGSVPSTAVRWDGSTIVDLGSLPGGIGSSAYAINNDGAIVGVAAGRPAMWLDGNVTDLSGGTGYGQANAINDSHVVAGYEYVQYPWQQASPIVAHYWGPEGDAPLERLPQHNVRGGYSEALGINDAGVIVGYSAHDTAPSIKAVMWVNGGPPIALPCDSTSAARDINNRNQIVGRASDSATLWENGVEYDLNDLIDPSCGWILREAYAINDLGQIVGRGNAPGGSHAFLLTPVHEPAPLSVEIDIKPGSDTNPINLGARGLVPVAILTTEDFDATTVDPETVQLAGASVATVGKGKQLQANEEDVDNDGDLDLVLHFQTQELALPSDATSAVLTGQTYDGMEIEGSDSIVIVPK